MTDKRRWPESSILPALCSPRIVKPCFLEITKLSQIETVSGSCGLPESRGTYKQKSDFHKRKFIRERSMKSCPVTHLSWTQQEEAEVDNAISIRKKKAANFCVYREGREGRKGM